MPWVLDMLAGGELGFVGTMFGAGFFAQSLQFGFALVFIVPLKRLFGVADPMPDSEMQDFNAEYGFVSARIQEVCAAIFPALRDVRFAHVSTNTRDPDCCLSKSFTISQKDC